MKTRVIASLALAIALLVGSVPARAQLYGGVPAATAVSAPVSLGNSSTAFTVNWSAGTVQLVTMTGNATATFTNPIAGQTYRLIATQDGTGGRTLTLPATVKCGPATCSADMVNGVASKTSVLEMTYDGTNYNVDMASAMPSGAACAGQATLSSASPSTATVSSKCLTGATNVVICTDCSGSSAGLAIACTPSAGSLAITGPNTNTDTVCWARVQ